MRSRLLLTLVAPAVALVLTGTGPVLTIAAAGPATAKPSALPTMPNKKILVGKSIGGVKPRMAPDVAVDLWGGPDTAAYCSEFSCIWTDNPNDTNRGSDGRAGMVFDNEDGSVYNVYIEVPEKGYDTPLAKLETSKGIHLGDTVEELKAAYGGKLEKKIVSGFENYEIRSKKTVTGFNLDGKHRIWQIIVRQK